MNEYRFKIGDFVSTGAVDPKFQVEGVAPTNHSSPQKTKLNIYDLSYGRPRHIKIWTDLSSVLSQSTRLTDGGTDGQSYGSRTYRQTDRQNYHR